MFFNILQFFASGSIRKKNSKSFLLTKKKIHSKYIHRNDNVPQRGDVEKKRMFLIRGRR